MHYWYIRRRASESSRMDELRDLAWVEFQEYTTAVSKPPQKAHEVVTISTSSSDELTYVHSETGDREIASFFDRPLRKPHTTSPQATLRLVRILRDASDTSLLAISPEALQRLARSPAAGFDPASFYLLAHRYDGFHRFPAGPHHRYKETVFFGSSMFCALWSIDPKARSTFAILLCRASYTATVQLVDRALAHYKTYILAPTMLGYVLCTAAIMRTERLGGDPGQLRRIERDTGFAYEGRPQVSARHNVRKLTRWLQESGQVVMIVASCKRNLRLISDMLECMMARPEAYDSVGSAATPVEIEVENRARECSSALLQAVPPLLSRIRASGEYVDYMKLRAERLSTTVSHSTRAPGLAWCSLCLLHSLRVPRTAHSFFICMRP